MLIRDDNFFTVMGFMVTELNLTGNDLLIYAIIYGFSQDDGSVFSGSRSYLAAWCNVSMSSVKRSLKSLQDKGLIEQVYHSADNTEVHYKAYRQPRADLTQGPRVKMTLATGQNDPSLGSNRTKPRVKMTQAIKEDNIEENIADNIVDNIVVCDTKTKRFQKPTFEEVESFATRNGAAVVDPQRFIDYYTANGWKVGKNQMKDWQAAFRMWESREKKSGTGSGSKKAETIPYMQNEYTEDHLKQKEEESLKLLDDLLGGE